MTSRLGSRRRTNVNEFEVLAKRIRDKTDAAQGELVGIKESKEWLQLFLSLILCIAYAVFYTSLDKQDGLPGIILTGLLILSCIGITSIVGASLLALAVQANEKTKWFDKLMRHIGKRIQFYAGVAAAIVLLWILGFILYHTGVIHSVVERIYYSPDY